MSDDGERMCPLCAEEMDLTDQQLKPCKCGYEICVWCWHHIVEMAEKDDTEGRCPACRTPYDKDRIVGTAANCERVVAEMNSEKRQKSQKPKMKSSAEARKHLSSARVIQRNLVYIIGLPSSLCDENLLEQKEYFGQYGKVLKVSISRPNSSSGQQASNNNTCSVYITYAREEEAVRCIQAVHNFVLEGKSLRACFGTTKYCHAWLRNLTCSNPDCLYLHDVGSQEDSFTKNEIISAYTRSRVPQIASNNLQRRSGSILPPPVDDVCSNGTVSGKHVVKSASNNTTSQIKVSANCSTVGKATALPAAASWGLRVSNCRQSAASGACSQSIAKQKVEAVNNLSSIKVSSAWHDDVVTTSKISEGRHTLHSVGRSRSLETSKLCIGRDCLTVVKDVLSETPLDVTYTPEISAWDDDEVTIFKVEESHATHSAGRLQLLEPVGPSIGRTSLSDVSLEPALDAARTSEFSMGCSTSSLAAAISDKGKGMAMARGNTHLPNSTGVGGLDRQSSNSDPVNIAHGHADVNGNVRDLCVGLSSVNLDNHLEVDHLKVDQHQSSLPNHSFISMMQNRVESPAVLYKAPAMSGSHVLGESHYWNSESQSQGLQSMENNMEDGRVLCVDERQRHSDATSQPSWLSFSCELSGIGNSSSNVSWNNNSGRMSPLLTEGSRSNGVEADKGLLLGGQNKPILSNRHMEDNLTDPSRSVKVSECSDVSYTKEKAKCVEISDSVANINKTASVDAVSDMVLLDFDPWDNSFSAANNLARLLGEAGKQDGSVKQSSLWKAQATNESRFSFARDESQANVLEHSFQDMVHPQNLCSSSQSSFGDGFQNGSFFHNFGYSNVRASSNTFASSDRIPGALKAKISAPPGFSLPNRAPPPGFSSLDRYDQAYGACSDNHLVGSLSLRSQPQMQLTENTTDVEFIDPAILAVGKGRLPRGINNSGFGMTSAFPAHLNSFENDPRFQLLMQQQSIPSQQDLRFLDRYGDRLLPLNESHLSSRLLAQNSSNVSSFGQLPLQHTRNGHISSSQWDGWNDVRIGNDVGVAENLRNDRFGLNNYFPGNEEQKFRIPSTGNVYNRAFGL